MKFTSRDISKHFCLPPFFLEKIEFQERNKFSVHILHEYAWIHSWIHPWYIYVAKTLKLINYNNTCGLITDYNVVSLNTAALTISFERRCLWYCAAVFLRIIGAISLLTFNFASARTKCFLVSTRKYLPQIRLSIL